MENKIAHRFGQIAIGHSALAILDISFDRILYPYVLLKLGTISGMILLTLLSGLICLVLILLYEWMKVDWLGVEVVEEMKENGRRWLDKLSNKKGIKWNIAKIIAYIPSKIFLLVMWCLKKNDVVAFFALSIYEDAFKTTAFLRHGKFTGLKGKDWLIFSSSLIISNIWWTLQWTILLVPLTWLFNLIME